MPIGLPDNGRRQADLLAQKAVGALRSSVFTTPVRAALDAPDHRTATSRNHALTGTGVSIQAFGLKPKLLQVWKWVRRTHHRVVEAHPEVSFAQIKVHQALHASGGVVTQVYPGGRDSVMLPSASFETSARFDAGMSGGPVFGEDGRVCGVVSSGVEANEDSEGYISFASAGLMVFALGVNENGQHVRIFELAKRGMIKTDEFFEFLQIADRDDGRIDIGFWYQRYRVLVSECLV